MVFIVPDLSQSPRRQKRQRTSPDVDDPGEGTGSDSDGIPAMFRSRCSKLQKTDEQRRRQADAEARHLAECEANRRAKDERLRRDAEALAEALATPFVLTTTPTVLRINFDFSSAPDGDSDSASDDGHGDAVVARRPAQSTPEARVAVTSHVTRTTKTSGRRAV